MSWQDDLRTLDSELAAGRISADEYRTRRDGLLSSAVMTGSPAATPQAQPESDAEKTAFIPPIGANTPPPPPAVQAAQAAQAAQSGQAAQAGHDQTQVVRGQVDNPDRTQVVAGSDRTQAVRGMDPDRTQHVVPVAPPPFQQFGASGQMRTASPPQGFPAQRPDQYGWNNPENDPNSPWNSASLGGAPSWSAQGPEVFDDVSKSGGKKKPLIIVAVIVLIAALGAGAYFLFLNKPAGPSEAAPQTSQAPPPPSEKPKDDLEIAELPGNAGPNPQFQTFADIEAAKSLTSKENNVYKTASAGKARLVNATLPENVNALVVTVESGSADAAATAVEALAKLQNDFGMKAYTGTAPSGVIVNQIEKTKDFPAAIRGHYAHGKTIVRVQMAGADLAKISKAFDEILAAQLEALPVE